MKFEDVSRIAEEILTEKRKYEHRSDYSGNKKGSYIEKGKTYWDYSGDGKPGNERIVTQIQLKAQMKDKYLSRTEIKRFLKSDASQKIYNHLKKAAVAKFGEDEDDPKYRAYLYGGLATAVTNTLSAKKKAGMSQLM